ncbi:bifunctional 4-hydroxy-2-oxoglutarate aldolase/2-dehydro-3-deoxy-phosphogluconate aldolase [Mariniblastus sp.]|nr:bifunctional 4-hydroxy-2-oxoglutarate aldolase/2-dehydro-3-deoxy-phosphogluconate aldolase [Mariniblastus sp.]MDB4755770.1 bifunctional 4-hydroxy-2-oxoglutarate aldolase/2-dehydro-3-deoxy-phosphogluconate aldolase [Mariniblastus sp.]
MSSKNNQFQQLSQSKVIAILRCEKVDSLVDVAKALLEGGIRIMEVTFTVPKALQIIEAVADQLGDQILLGAGTVLDTATARSAMLAGAEFFVSPGTSLEVIQTCRTYDKMVIPGAMTPTEVLTAWQAGCDAVKIFPSDCLGPKHIKALKGPLPQIPLIPTGGINAENAREFMDAGALAVGVGGSLAPKSAIERGDLDMIRNNAAELCKSLQ